MTEFKMDPSRGCVEEYIHLTVNGNGVQKALRIALYISTGLIAALGVIITVITSQPLLLLITLVGLAAGIAYPVLIHFFLKSAVNKTVETMKKQEGASAAVSETNILMIMNGIPRGIIEWSSITSITEGKTGFFLKTKDDAVLMLASDMVASGTYGEAAQVLRAKAAAIKPAEEK